MKKQEHLRKMKTQQKKATITSKRIRKTQKIKLIGEKQASHTMNAEEAPAELEADADAMNLDPITTKSSVPCLTTKRRTRQSNKSAEQDTMTISRTNLPRILGVEVSEEGIVVVLLTTEMNVLKICVAPETTST